MRRNSFTWTIALTTILCSMVVSADADQAEKHFERGNQLNRAGRKDEAAKEFREAFRHNPKHDWAEHGLRVGHRLLRGETDCRSSWPKDNSSMAIEQLPTVIAAGNKDCSR